MARHPEPGRVKTRLAAVLGDDRACALHRAFVLDLADRLASLPYEVTWAHTPAAAPFPALLPHARCVPQVGGDLGAELVVLAHIELGVGDVAFREEALGAHAERAARRRVELDPRHSGRS